MPAGEVEQLSPIEVNNYRYCMISCNLYSHVLIMFGLVSHNSLRVGQERMVSAVQFHGHKVKVFCSFMEGFRDSAESLGLREPILHANTQ